MKGCNFTFFIKASQFFNTSIYCIHPTNIDTPLTYSHQAMHIFVPFLKAPSICPLLCNYPKEYNPGDPSKVS